MLKFFLEVLHLSPQFIKASGYNFRGRKYNLIVNMCRSLDENVYIFGNQGKNYAEIEDFEKDGIKVVFQEYIHPRYQQMYGNFISHLSVLDLLFNCGEESTRIIMSGNISRDALLEISSTPRH